MGAPRNHFFHLSKTRKRMQIKCKRNAKAEPREGEVRGSQLEECMKMKLQMVPIIVVFMQDMKPNNWFLLLLEAFS